MKLCKLLTGIGRRVAARLGSALRPAPAIPRGSRAGREARTRVIFVGSPIQPYPFVVEDPGCD